MGHVMKMAKAAGWHVVERYAPWLTFAVVLSATYLFWQYAHQMALQKHRVQFDTLASDTANRILRRIAYNEQILHGVRAFYLNQHSMERREFEGYIASLEIEKNYPGIQSISFAPLITDANKSAYLDALRRSGLPDYRIEPGGTRDLYAPVVVIAPSSGRNVRVLGFDNLSEPVRRATVEQARDEERAVISERLSLRQDVPAAPQSGFLMFLPVYKRGSVHDTQALRRANIEGWFAASFRMEDLLASVLDKRTSGINIAVFDGNEISDQSLMFSKYPGFSHVPAFSHLLRIKAAGHTWSMRMSSLPEFEARLDRSEEYQVLVWGGTLSVLLTFMVWLLMRHQRRMRDMASEIGRELDMRMQAESKSHDLSVFNKLILEKSPSGIAVYRYSGLCVMVNEAYARAIGGTVKESLAQNFRSNASWARNGLLEFADQAFNTGLTFRRDIEGVTSFGRTVVLECIFSCIDISGEPHLLLITNDVSDRARAERALGDSMRNLEKKELAKTRFLAAAGHDLRQPLTAANMFIHALKSTALTPRQKLLIQRLDISMSTLGGLLDALLNVSKLDAGRIRPEYSSINVPELIIWLEQNLAPMAREKSLSFRLYFPMSRTLFVRSDIGLIKSVLMNLASNAIKFTASGGVLVSARLRNGAVLFQVWDTGIGIGDEYIEHIFDEFYQVDNPQRDRESGLGLGLSIVKRTLALLGVSIGCRSRIARGTVFSFSLPLDRSSSVIPQTGEEMLWRENSGDHLKVAGKKIVLVEDDELVAQATQSCLEDMGGQVICFRRAEDALRHAETGSADYYIVDYMLGGALSGIEFLKLLGRRSATAVSAVLVTGDTSSAFIRESAGLAWPVLFKPVDVSELIEMLVRQGSGAGSGPHGVTPASDRPGR